MSHFTAAEYTSAFKAVDVNHTGFIESEQLKDALDALGQAMSEEELAKRVSIVNKEHDGKWSEISLAIPGRPDNA